MPVLRALTAFVLLGWTVTWLASAPVTAPPPEPVVVVAAQPSTSRFHLATDDFGSVRMERLEANRTVPPKASRALVRPRPARVQAATELDDATRQRVITAICSHPWDCGLMVRVAGCESGLRPWARNGRHVGIFQIAGATPGLIEEHVALAFSMWRNRGMAPWYPSRHCWG